MPPGPYSELDMAAIGEWHDEETWLLTASAPACVQEQLAINKRHAAKKAAEAFDEAKDE